MSLYENKKKGKKKMNNLRNNIEQALKDQLKVNNTDTKYYNDIVTDYMRLWDIKNKLLKDIEERGVSVTYNHGGGQSGVKSNDSVALLLKVSERMMKLLDSMGIKPDVVAGSYEDDDECDL